MADRFSPLEVRHVNGPRLAVIPARGGSKRLPNKNIRELAGRPLIAHTIEAALGSGLFQRVIVSTDSEEIAAVAMACGAEVPFRRSPSLADDHVPVSAATADALERVDPEGRYQAVAQLMATCPLRTAGDIQASFNAFVASGADSQLSVTRFGWQNPWWAFRMSDDGVLQALFPNQATARGQDLPPLFSATGAIWWARAEVVRRARTYHVPGRTGWAIPWPRGVDIDTEEDWAMAAQLLTSQSEVSNAI
ncbi:MAG TPA: acylneuraminate cytidylyltransferase family protein [Gemmatimonadales bacterium]|nr:acylneuraminate cytidylyltransferase family protein [Gemmatimonadales bacterium]